MQRQGILKQRMVLKPNHCNRNWRITIFAAPAVLLLFWLILFLHRVSLDMSTSKDAGQESHRDTVDIGSRKPGVHGKWPPSHLLDIRNLRSGFYDLTLRPSVISNTMRSKDTYYAILMSLYEGKKINGSRLKQLVMMDRAVRMGGSKPDFYLYPQTMDTVQAVKSIRAGLPVDEYPMNDPELFVIESPQVACSETSQRGVVVHGTYPLDLVILVKTCLHCSVRRMHIRSTYMQSHLWSGFRIQHAFVLGLPFIQASERMLFDGVNISVKKKIVSDAQLKHARRRLFSESARFKDLLIGGFHDTYYNLTLKQILTFRWASAFCKHLTPLFLFMDDDMSINPANLIRFINRISTIDKPYFNGGILLPKLTPFRPGSSVGGAWAVSEDEFPWSQYPNYSSGRGYLVGADYVCDAAIAMAFTQNFRIDDVFLGIVWAKLKYPVLNIPGFRLRISDVKEVNQTIVASSLSMDKYINWRTGEVKNVSSHKFLTKNI
ncbi:unnamed protein product [Calicophoron daubneyi]|uniref:Hexosyltransferase n=1 Tax=Calicophoron daubneyi TaxID=300641 RepID=A0AAV2T9R0_CALDB